MLRVNGELIDPNLVEETFSRIKTEAEQRLQISCCERDPEFQEQAEREVADSILIAQEAEKRYPEISEDEITPKLKEMIDLYREHGASWEMLESQRDMMRHEISASMRMDKLITELTGGDELATEEEIDAFYQDHINEYRSPAEARSLHVMKNLNEKLAPADVFGRMCELREEALQEDADFEKICERETDKTSKEIDLGWIPFDRPTNPFESVLFSLREGEVSPVISYEHALHLIKITGLKPAETAPMEEIREELEQRTVARKKRKVLQTLAEELRKDATIETVDYSEEMEE